MIACLFNPGPCIADAATGLADAVLSLFPFGLYGLVFLAGMIVGERIGLWGILVAVIGWLALRFRSKDSADDFRGEVSGKDALSPRDSIVRFPANRPRRSSARRTPKPPPSSLTGD